MIDDLLLKVKNRQLVMILLPIVGGALIGTLFIVKPALKKISVAKHEKMNLSQKTATFNNIVALENKIMLYKNKIAVDGSKGSVSERLNLLASDSGLVVLSTSSDEKKAVGTSFEVAQVRIESEGNYHQLGDFVSRVENLPECVKILSVDIKADLSNNTADTVAGKGLRQKPVYQINVGAGFFYGKKDAL